MEDGQVAKKRYNYKLDFKAQVLQALKANGGNISKTASDKSVSIFYFYMNLHR